MCEGFLAESVYRMESLGSDVLEGVEEIRIEVQALGPSHYRFILNNAHGSGKTPTEEADEAEDAFLAGTTTDRG